MPVSEIDGLEAALTIVGRLSPRDPHAARLRHFEVMMRLFEETGTAPPPWIEELRARIEGPLPPLSDGR